MNDFLGANGTYIATSWEFVADLTEIEPPKREFAFDCDGLKRNRMICVLHGISAGSSLPPVQLVSSASTHYRFVLKDGYHRYHASIAAGFLKIPAIHGWVPEV